MRDYWEEGGQGIRASQQGGQDDGAMEERAIAQLLLPLPQSLEE